MYEIRVRPLPRRTNGPTNNRDVGKLQTNFERLWTKYVDKKRTQEERQQELKRRALPNSDYVPPLRRALPDVDSQPRYAQPTYATITKSKPETVPAKKPQRKTPSPSSHLTKSTPNLHRPSTIGSYTASSLAKQKPPVKTYSFHRSVTPPPSPRRSPFDDNNSKYNYSGTFTRSGSGPTTGFGSNRMKPATSDTELNRKYGSSVTTTRRTFGSPNPGNVSRMSTSYSSYSTSSDLANGRASAIPNLSPGLQRRSMSTLNRLTQIASENRHKIIETPKVSKTTSSISRTSTFTKGDTIGHSKSLGSRRSIMRTMKTMPAVKTTNAKMVYRNGGIAFQAPV